MKLLITITALIFIAPVNALGGVSRSDVQAREIERLVSRLSWESTAVTCNMMALQIHPRDEASLRLIKIGKPATDELLDALTDGRKALAAHVILTAIWEPRPVYFVIGSAVYKRKLFWRKFAGVVEHFNGLTWSTSKGDQRIARRDMIDNASRWRQKVTAYRAAVST